MTAKVVWTQDSVEYTLTNGMPLCRLAGWTPRSTPVGPRPHQLADGRPRKWVHRYEHGARFRLEYIPQSFHGLALALQSHLEEGGLVTVHTDDLDGHTYDCYLAPDVDTRDMIEQTDRVLLDYAMTFELISAAVPAVPLLCAYDEALDGS